MQAAVKRIVSNLLYRLIVQLCSVLLSSIFLVVLIEFIILFSFSA